MLEHKYNTRTKITEDYFDSKTDWDVSCGLKIVVPWDGIWNSCPDLCIDAGIWWINWPSHAQIDQLHHSKGQVIPKQCQYCNTDKNIQLLIQYFVNHFHNYIFRQIKV